MGQKMQFSLNTSKLDCWNSMFKENCFFRPIFYTFVRKKYLTINLFSNFIIIVLFFQFVRN